MADSEFAGDVFGGLGYGGRVVVLESGVDHADGALFKFGWVFCGHVVYCSFRGLWVEGVD